MDDNNNTELRNQINEYCHILGNDPLLVQGAGGNVSWKEDGTMWIKASGTWLSDAKARDIFVPIDFFSLKEEIAKNNFNAKPAITEESSLHPSIETMLHALMPQKVVIHVHAINALVYILNEDYNNELSSKLDPSINWLAVEYFKPGPKLAEAVSNAFSDNKDANVVFLQNHGVVIGGNDTQEIKQTLNKILDSLDTQQATKVEKEVDNQVININNIGFQAIKDKEIHQLVFNINLFKNLDANWALYPDHVVFLGAEAYAFDTIVALEEHMQHSKEIPELVFIYDVGVYFRGDFSIAKQAQLKCYFDVISRVKPQQKITALETEEIAELLDWDAEKYRMKIAK